MLVPAPRSGLSSTTVRSCATEGLRQLSIFDMVVVGKCPSAPLTDQDKAPIKEKYLLPLGLYPYSPP